MRWGRYDRYRPSGRHQPSTVLVIELQRVGKQGYGVEPWRTSGIPFQIADRPRADPREFGQRLLSETGGQSPLLQDDRESRVRGGHSCRPANGECSVSSRHGEPTAERRI